MSQVVKYDGGTVGCDPELFIETDGKIVGAEKILPKGVGRQVVLDGVQLEIHTSPSGCRASIVNEMRGIFKKLDAELKTRDHKAKVSFSSVIQLSKEELDSLSEASKKLGCAPSNNYYGKGSLIKASDGATLLTRSAGGHIHITCAGTLDRRRELVPICDIVMGNTCVLVDPDPYAAERRKKYGAAGEHRLPSYGVEYRTLSNFWLRSSHLTSMAFGLAKMSLAIFQAGSWAETKLKSLVRAEDIEKAINTNDRVLAQANFDKIKPFIYEHCLETDGIQATSVDLFQFFIDKIGEHDAKFPGKGIEYWFPEDPMTHWAKEPEGHRLGWELFLYNVVAPHMLGQDLAEVWKRVKPRREKIWKSY